MPSSVSFEYLQNRLRQPVLSAYSPSGVSITVILGGTAVPLKQTTCIHDFTANGSGTSFTVKQTGYYLVSYDIQTTAGLLMNAALYQNGKAVDALVRSPGLAARSFSCSGIILLNEDDEISLRMYGVLGTAILSGGVGAYLTAVRVM